jgi:hypothetical protein
MLLEWWDVNMPQKNFGLMHEQDALWNLTSSDRVRELMLAAREREQAKANAAIERAHAKAAEQVQEVQRRAEKRLAGSLDLSRMNPAAAATASAADATVTEPARTTAEASADTPPAAHATVARLGAIKDVPVSLEMRAQKFAVLAHK